MEPGGSHGLQNRSRPDDVGLGGFDSHALPPSRSVGRRVLLLPVTMPLSAKSIVVGLCLFAGAAPTLAAQSADSIRLRPAPTAAQLDSLRTPIGPRRAFFYSFLVPGYSQSVLKRNKAATLFMLVEAISIAMIRESAADVHEARRMGSDSTIVSYVDEAGQPVRIVAPPRFNDAYISTREAHVEDWIALLVANHLFAGADAYVAANLWDVKGRLAIRAVPHGAVLGASFTW